jgi:ornithine decarboxylase (EC 4.1.1.17)
VLKELHGFIHMFEDTPEFVARHILRETKTIWIRWRRRSSVR